MTALLDAALNYANRGWPVLPLHGWVNQHCTCGHNTCGSPAKHPRTRNGLHDATTDPDTIRAWWQRWPQANIGLRTGIAFDALDIDGDTGFNSVNQAEHDYGQAEPGPTSHTGGGGLHRLYQPTGIGNRAGILEHVDWRGTNGYIVAPPSLHATGNRYQWSEHYPADEPLQPVTGWLHDLLFPAPREPRPAPDTTTANTGSDRDRYVRRAIDAEIGELVRAPEGTRNDALNRAAFNLYQLAAAGEVADTELTALLTRAATGIGLGQREIDSTLNSARTAAGDHPRAVPQLRVVNDGTSARRLEPRTPPIEPAPQPDTPPDTTSSRFDYELREFLNQPEPDYQWLIPGIVERGDRVILTGPEGGGKSTLLRQIAVQVAAGIHPFTLETIKPRRTLIVDLENGRRHLRRSLRPLADTAGRHLADDMCRVISLPSGIDLLDATHVDWLTHRFQTDQPEIVIIGPIYKMANGDPVSEEVAKKVAYTIDRLRTEHECCFLIEAHQPYASQGGNRPERPYGASLWSRWPEFGLHISISGQLRHWRGDRDERQWPKTLQHGTPWPWEVVEDLNDTPEYNGPSHCRDAVAQLLAEHPTEEFSLNAMHTRLRARGQSFRKETVSVAAEQLAADHTLTVRNGARNSRLFRHGRPQDALS